MVYTAPPPPPLLYSYDEAEKMYEEYVDKNPDELLMRKRLVAIRKARGDTAEAIRQLTELLKM